MAKSTAGKKNRSGAKKQKKGGFSCCKKKSVASTTDTTNTTKNTKKTNTSRGADTKTPKTVQKPAMPKSAPKSGDSKSTGKKSGPQAVTQSNKPGQKPLEKQKLQPTKNEKSGSNGNKNYQKKTCSQTLKNLLEDPMLKTAVPIVPIESASAKSDESNKRDIKKISNELKKVALEPVKLRKFSTESQLLADENQPEQSLFVKRYVRNGRVFVNWEYFESYPVGQKGPSFSQLLNSKPKSIDMSIAEPTSAISVSSGCKGCNCKNKQTAGTTSGASGASGVQRMSGTVYQESQEYSSATSVEMYRTDAIIATRK